MVQSIIFRYLNQKVVADLKEFINDIELGDNNMKADAITKYMEVIGFIEVGCGTNRICFRKDDYVFKIALDDRGVLDNNLEYELSKKLKPYVAVNYENTGIVSVAEYVDTMTSTDFQFYYDRAMQILMNLGQFYILNDVGPKSFMNWGINKDGVPVILDYAYLTPITPETNFTCPKCGEQIYYNVDFTEFICHTCGRNVPLSFVQNTNIDEFVEMGFDDSTDDNVIIDDVNTEGFFDNSIE